ncbi:MAG: deoxyribonuclease IV [Candidatus Hodarchaeales archaeon]|jgi:deoxyribonuclease-4
MRFGFHVSIAGSLAKAVDRAVQKECETIQIFTRSPRMWRVKDLDEKNVFSFKKRLKEEKISPIFSHMPYLPNLAAPDDDTYKKSVEAFELEMVRAAQLEIPYVVTHLGSHKGKGRKFGINRTVAAIQRALEVDSKATILLENTSGRKNTIGARFEDIAEIIEKCDSDNRLGVCYDTAHGFSAGYDIRNAKVTAKTFQELDATIGLDRLKLIHANDTHGEFKSGKDHHEHIGKGFISEEGFRSLLRHEPLRNLPVILETPQEKNKLEDDLRNIRFLRSLAE